MLGIIGIVISVYQFVLFIRFIMQWIDKVDTNSKNHLCTVFERNTYPYLPLYYTQRSPYYH
jgi:uncharacterized protein YggT (Ycf19 family)